MPAVLSTKEKQLIKFIPHQPSVLITMPFEPKLNGVSQLQQQLRSVVKRAERLLLSVYQKSEVEFLMNRVEALFGTLNYRSFRKSVVALVTGSSHKIFYLDMAVREQVSINSTLEVKDLLRMKANAIKYLVLILNDHWAKTYLADELGCNRIKSDSLKPFANFKESGNPAMDSGKNVGYRSLYKHICSDFSMIAAAYQLPVFVIGSVVNVNRFCHLVKSRKEIVQVIYSNTDNLTERDIFEHIKPYFDNWQFIRQRYLRRQLEEANKNHRVSAGITDIIKTVKNSSCKLLVVEDSLLYPDPEKEVLEINSIGQVVTQATVVGVQLDLIIAELLESGVEVEVVPDGILKDYNRVALIIH